MAALPDEQTPLLRGATDNGPQPQPEPVVTVTDAKKSESLARRMLRAVHVEHRILLAGFFITLSFSFTQVPIFYVFHLMECDIYYDTHPPHVGPGDRCTVNEIAARTATDFSVLGMSTTFFGTFNLFVAGWMVKRFGPKAALFLQTFIPAIRVATQILGVVAGRGAGIAIIQLTQAITLFGGPTGYILVINIIAGELVTPLRRTAVFGMLQGSFMLGQAIGYLTGGMIGDTFGIKAPFEVAFCSFLLSSAFSQFVLPYIDPESMSDGKSKATGFAAMFSPLRVVVPQTIRLASGLTRKHYGVVFLCSGVFLATLATGYAPLLIQMYATAVFEFQQADNGYLMFGYALARALFLLFLFPPIIDLGRKWYIAREAAKSSSSAAADRKRYEDDDVNDDRGSIPGAPGPIMSSQAQAATEPSKAPMVHENEGCAFDLFFLRWSLLLDGILTTGAAYATEKWHIYLATFLLPFGSGTAPATKGVITEMCPPSQRADALNTLTLVENIARLATQGLFGFVFAALAEVGKAQLTFFCNAALALVAMGVLMLSHFPPAGSTLVDGEDVDSEEETLVCDPASEEEEAGR